MNGKDSFRIELRKLSYPGAADFKEVTNFVISDSVTGSRYKEYIAFVLI